MSDVYPDAAGWAWTWAVVAAVSGAALLSFAFEIAFGR